MLAVILRFKILQNRTTYENLSGEQFQCTDLSPQEHILDAQTGPESAVLSWTIGGVLEVGIVRVQILPNAQRPGRQILLLEIAQTVRQKCPPQRRVHVLSQFRLKIKLKRVK